MPDYLKRRSNLIAQFQELGVEAMLVSEAANVTYLTGFTGDSSYLLLTPEACVIASDERFRRHLEEECPEIDARIRGPDVGLLAFLKQIVEELNCTRLGIESQSITLATYQDFEASLGASTKLVPTKEAVESLRKIKDAEEIALTRRAVWVAERAFLSIRAALHPQMTERDVAFELEHIIRRLGGDGFAFEPIVAVGPRSALAHAKATEKKLCESPLLLMDWGATFRGYKSDLTRVLALGTIPPKFEEIYSVVLAAQQAAIEQIGPGVSTQAIDRTAREVINDAGYGEQFGHGLGHGIGLHIHEAPGLNPRVDSTLEAGMIITIEPGIYFPGEGGVRIEDDILVTSDGYEVLSSVDKQWDQVQWPIQPETGSE